MSDPNKQLEALRSAVHSFGEVLEILGDGPLDPVVEQYIRDHVSPVDALQALRTALGVLDDLPGGDPDLLPVGYNPRLGRLETFAPQGPGSGFEGGVLDLPEDVHYMDVPDPVHPLGPSAECSRHSFWGTNLSVSLTDMGAGGVPHAHAALYYRYRDSRWWHLWKEGSVEYGLSVFWNFPLDSPLPVDPLLQDAAEVAIVFVDCIANIVPT